jgi:hypothetical protein
MPVLLDHTKRIAKEASRKQVLDLGTTCDEGLKGFNAPANDPMKAALVCDLVLCSPCEALRRITFEAKNESHGGRGRKRSRR